MTENTQKNWLQRLKDESWEAELLVSAVAIYAILQSFSFLDWVINKFIDYLAPSQYFIGYGITVMGFLAIGALAAMFVIHFALRAYWIGLVGLNSVYPDYGMEDSAYSPIFTKKITDTLPKLSKSITKVDELCSVIFASAFSIMLIYSYFSLVFILGLLLYNLLIDFVPKWILLIPIALLGLALALSTTFAMVANHKKFRSNEKVQHFYFLITKWVGLIFYGPLYKTIFQITMTFMSNAKKKKTLSRLMIVIIALGFIFAMYRLINSNYGYLVQPDRPFDSSREYPEYYGNTNQDENFLLYPEINNNLIQHPTLTLFVPIFENESKRMSKYCNLTELSFFSKPDAIEKAKQKMDRTICYQNNLKVFLDETLIEVEFLKKNHQRTGQFGMTAFIDLNGKSKKTHQLKIQKKINETESKEWIIPFYYAGPISQ